MLVLICLTLLIKKSLKVAGTWPIRYIFGNGANFLNPNNLLHVADKLFFEVAELISDK